MRKWTIRLALVAAVLMLAPASAFAAGTSPSPTTTVVTADDGSTSGTFSAKGTQLSQTGAESISTLAASGCWTYTAKASRYIGEMIKHFHRIDWCGNGSKVTSISRSTCWGSEIYPYNYLSCEKGHGSWVMPRYEATAWSHSTFCIWSPAGLCTTKHGFDLYLWFYGNGFVKGNWKSWP